MQNYMAITKTPQRRTTPVHILLSNPDHIPNDLLPFTSFWRVCHQMSRDCTERVTRYGLNSGERKKTCNDAAKRESSLEDDSRSLGFVCHRMPRDCTERVTRYGLKSGEQKNMQWRGSERAHSKTLRGIWSRSASLLAASVNSSQGDFL